MQECSRIVHVPMCQLNNFCCHSSPVAASLVIMPWELPHPFINPHDSGSGTPDEQNEYGDMHYRHHCHFIQCRHAHRYLASRCSKKAVQSCEGGGKAWEGASNSAIREDAAAAAAAAGAPLLDGKGAAVWECNRCEMSAAVLGPASVVPPTCPPLVVGACPSTASTSSSSAIMQALVSMQQDFAHNQLMAAACCLMMCSWCTWGSPVFHSVPQRWVSHFINQSICRANVSAVGMSQGTTCKQVVQQDSMFWYCGLAPTPTPQTSDQMINSAPYPQALRPSVTSERQGGFRLRPHRAAQHSTAMHITANDITAPHSTA